MERCRPGRPHPERSQGGVREAAIARMAAPGVLKGRKSILHAPDAPVISLAIVTRGVPEYHCRLIASSRRASDRIEDSRFPIIARPQKRNRKWTSPTMTRRDPP